MREAKRERDPRALSTPVWQRSLALYQLKAEGLPAGVSVYVATDYTEDGKSAAFEIRVEALPAHGLSGLHARQTIHAIHRGLAACIAENQARGAMTLLQGEDAPDLLPRNRPRANEAACFWVRRSDYPALALAIRSSFGWKDTIKKVFEGAWIDGAKDPSERVRKGWWVEAKVWVVCAPNAYPRILHELRAEGMRLHWISREGFPPAPPVAVYEPAETVRMK